MHGAAEVEMSQYNIHSMISAVCCHGAARLRTAQTWDWSSLLGHRAAGQLKRCDGSKLEIMTFLTVSHFRTVRQRGGE